MNQQLSRSEIFTKEGLQIPENTTQEQWEAIHRDVIICKKAAGRWLSQSRKYATDRWGLDYAVEAELQMELALGLPQPEERPSLNPADKSKALVTIEGISQSFSMWQRKMQGEIPTWDRPRLERALGLLAPLEQQAKQIRELLNTAR